MKPRELSEKIKLCKRCKIEFHPHRGSEKIEVYCKHCNAVASKERMMRKHRKERKKIPKKLRKKGCDKYSGSFGWMNQHNITAIFRY